MSVILHTDTSEWVLEGEYEINRVALQIPEPCHTHRFIEVVYTYHGKGRHIIDDREYIVGHGDLLVVACNSRHTVEPIQELKYVDIMIEPSFANDLLRGTEDAFLLSALFRSEKNAEHVSCDRSLLSFDGEERARLESLIEWTEEEQKRKAPDSAFFRHSVLKLLLGLIYRKLSSIERARFSVNDTLLAYIEKNCVDQLREEDLAAKCYYTTAHFSRAFKRYTGRTFTEYVCDCRIKRAKKLLVGTDKPIERILSECGFRNRTAFFKRFFDRVGCTPLQYRKNQK